MTPPVHPTLCLKVKQRLAMFNQFSSQNFHYLVFGLCRDSYKPRYFLSFLSKGNNSDQSDLPWFKMASHVLLVNRLPSKRTVNGILLANLCGLFFMFLIPMQLNLIKNVIVATEVACLLVTIHCLFLFIVSMENWKFVIIKQLKVSSRLKNINKLKKRRYI